MRKKPAKLDRESLWQYALRALSARALSIGELRARLEARAQTAGEVPATLAKLKQYGMLDDRLLADTFASARLENQGFGQGRVLRELRRRRVAPLLAEEAVSRSYRGVDENDLIAAFLARKYRRVDLAVHLADPKRFAAAYRRLRYAGFSAANAIRVLRRYSQAAEDMESLEDSDQT